MRLLFVAAPRDIIELSNDEEEVPLIERRRRGRASSGKAPEGQVRQSRPVLETVVERSRDLTRTSVTFANPLSTDRPSGSTALAPAALVQLRASDPMATPTALPSSLFAVYETSDDPLSAAREALLQVTLVMEQMKVVHEASQVAYNATTALQANIKFSWFPTDLLGCDNCNCRFTAHMMSLDDCFGTFHVHL